MDYVRVSESASAQCQLVFLHSFKTTLVLRKHFHIPLMIIPPAEVILRILFRICGENVKRVLA